MKNSYSIKLPSGDLITLACTQFELRKKIAEQLTNIPQQQIVILDKDFQLFDLNRLIMATQIQGRAQIQYQVLDLQQLIKEWLKQSQSIQSQKANLEAKATEIAQLKKELSEQMAILNGITSENQSVSSQYAALKKSTNEQIATLQSQLEDSKNKNIQDVENLQKHMASQKQEFEQEKMNLLNALNDFNENNKKLEAQYHQQINQCNQLKAENNNTIQQAQQLYEQLQQYTQYIQTQNGFIQKLQNDNQEKESNMLQQIKDLEDKHKQDINYKIKQAKQKENEAETTITQLQQDLSNQKSIVSRLTKRISDLEKSINEIEQEKNSKELFGASVNQQVQAISKELNKKKNELQNVAFERDNLITELDNVKAQFTQQFLATDQNYKATISELEEEIKTKEEIIKRIQIELEKQQQISKDLNLKLKDRDSTIDQLSRDISQLRYEIENKNQDGNNLSLEKKKIDSEKEQFQKELAETTKLYEQTKQQFRDSELERRNLKGLIQQKEIEFSTLTTKFTESERQKNQYLDQCRKMNEDYQLAQEQQIKEAEKWAIQGQVSEAKISRVIQNFGDTKIYEKLSGPLEKIMLSEFKINQFNKDPNFQADRTNYNLYEIGLDNNKFNQYVKQGKFFLIDECFTYTDRKQITGQRSIQVSAESEFYKGYLIRIEETQEETLKGKTLLRKDLKLQISASGKIEDAARLANNNIFCAWLQQQFNKDLAEAKLQTMGYAIQRQFILEHKEKKEFYYCELVEEGEYKKINGGKFVPQKEDVHQYFNAFSLYSHNYFQNELMITNFQICGNNIHDMIVNTTHKGLFSPLDQGPNEYLQFQDIITKQPADILAKCWNENIRRVAQNALTV